jgi:hypothetical protein
MACLAKALFPIPAKPVKEQILLVEEIAKKSSINC